MGIKPISVLVELTTLYKQTIYTSTVWNFYSQFVGVSPENLCSWVEQGETSVFAGYIKLKKFIYFICNNNCYNCTAKSLLYYL